MTTIFTPGDVVRRTVPSTGYPVGNQNFQIKRLEDDGPSWSRGWPIDEYDMSHDPRNLALVARVTVADPVIDPVNHPSHYKQGGLEAIDVLEAFGLTRDGRLFNAGKYILRAGKKDNNTELQDLKKAIWYLKRYIAAQEAEAQK